ncbi:hypothetical protein WA026_003227 [Henosepilachna vigintioctopunctata]|uniref:DHHA2 domain-containing protein n=1 Tax=Henosepilachna vigintioctopunctata TaxID=420089 RepID=A0AAW1TH99_9CUCU
MNKLKGFLEKSYSALKEWKSLKEIHIVLGNESCDLDSTICSIAYGYFLFEQMKINSADIGVFSVLNVSAENFLIRTEHCALLKNIGIDLEKLIYRSEVKLEELFISKKYSIKTYLVDHHVLSQNDELLKDTVCKIFDHRPVNESVKWPANVTVRIQPVGSCATLIVDEILKNDNLLFKELAYLLYCTIIFDTLAVLPENKKATPLDIEMVTKLEKKFGFQESRLSVFKKIVDLHADTSTLTVKQILIRDLKFVNNIPIPALPMLVETFLKLPDVEQNLNEMSIKNNAPFIVLVGIESNPDIKRDIALFVVKSNINLKKLLAQEFKNNSGFNFQEMSSGFENVILLRQLNIENTRKQILPIVQQFVEREKI